jgi:predicted PurR-regulated permease PerM
VVWAFVIILVLMIPILAIVIDSQIGQALAARISRSVPGSESELAHRLESLEADVRYLTESMESMREESEFVRSLIEGGSSVSLGPGAPESSSDGDA